MQKGSYKNKWQKFIRTALKVKEMMLKNHDFESIMISEVGSVMGTYTSKGAILISVL